MTRSMVTGAAGFIGSHLVDRLLAEGHQVIGIDNLATGDERNIEQALCVNAVTPRRFIFLNLDVQAPELTDIVAGSRPDIIFHLAAQVDARTSARDPHFDARTNVLGTINLCEASRHSGVRRVVYAASGESHYGATGFPSIDDAHPMAPASPNAAGKLAGELYLRAYAAMYGVSPICLALAHVYGPRQNPSEAAGIALVAGAMATGRDGPIPRDDTVTRDYVYVDDVVEAFVRAGRAPLTTTGVYPIGTGHPTSLNQVHRLLSAHFDCTALPEYRPAPSGELPATPADLRRSLADLGWRPAVDLEAGIAHTVAWLTASLGTQPLAVGA